MGQSHQKLVPLQLLPVSPRVTAEARGAATYLTALQLNFKVELSPSGFAITMIVPSREQPSSGLATATMNGLLSSKPATAAQSRVNQSRYVSIGCFGTDMCKA